LATDASLSNRQQMHHFPTNAGNEKKLATSYAACEDDNHPLHNTHSNVCHVVNMTTNAKNACCELVYS